MDDNNRSFTDEEMFKAAVNDLDADELDNNYHMNDLTGNIVCEEIEKSCAQCGCKVTLSDNFCPHCGAIITDELDSLVHVDGLQDKKNEIVMGYVTTNSFDYRYQYAGVPGNFKDFRSPKPSLKERIKAKFRNNR